MSLREADEKLHCEDDLGILGGNLIEGDLPRILSHETDWLSEEGQPWKNPGATSAG